MKMSLRQYCIEHGRDTLLQEWDAARNGGLTPSDVSFGSHQKVWWQCSKGHSWQAKVYSRSEGSGCPYCTGRKETPENSLAIQVPALEAEWDAEKNAPLKFADLTVGSHKRSGGGVLQGIPTIRSSRAVCWAPAVPSARGVLFCRTKTPSRQGIPHLLPNGIPRRTLLYCRRWSPRER